MKTFGEARIDAGETCLVVDLGACCGMDSTFMGTIAGLASRLSDTEGGVLQIAAAGDRNRRSFQELGLDFLIAINPPSPAWEDRLVAIRSALNPPQAPGTIGQIQRAEHVLEAHQNLIGINDKNAHTFEEVVNLLENELAEKKKLAGPDETKQG